MGGMSMSGGSLDWLRKILGEPQISYTDFEQLLEKLPTGPTGIVYFPYLAGSGSPHTDIHMRGAFFGLDQSHDRYDMIKAVLEGTAFEAEFIRQAAQRIKADDLELFIASGGGSNLFPWMQIKADVSGCVIEVPEFSDMTLLGAALVAGIGCGIYSGESDSRSTLRDIPSTRFQPDQSRHQEYNQIYLEGFLALQASLREISTRLRSTPPSIEN
jgi:xylulokinase